jgi:hypothetical protein
VQDILLARAAALKLDVSPADLEKAEADAKKNLPEGAFEQELARRKLTVADMRQGPAPAVADPEEGPHAGSGGKWSK